MKKTYHGLTVKDAENALRVTLSVTNVVESIPRDPENCAFAKCMKETLGISNVAIFKTTAYIESKGKSIIERYIPSLKVKEFIERFDEGKLGGVPSLQTFDFNPPSESRRLDYEKEPFQTQPVDQAMKNPVEAKVEIVATPRGPRKPHVAHRGRIRFD